MPPCATYQQHLRTLEQGLPVWDPSPKNSLEIIPGSVLYPGISGTFSVLFNARKSADDTHWQPHGVPRGFRTLDEEFGPLVVDGPRTVVGLRGWNCIGVECTREVSGGLDIGVPAGAAPIIAAGGGFKLTCREASGALLALKHDPITTYIESSAHVVSYMMRHHASWLELANSQARPGLGLGLKLEDLYFVTGTTKVPQWFIGVFECTTERERGARLECTVTDVFSLNAEVTDIRTIHRTPILKKGPTQRNMTMSIDRELPWDQCIFLHYFKMKKRVLIAPKVIRAASGPDQLPGSEPDNDAPILLVDVCDDDVEVEFEEESGRSTIVDPVNELLDYILEYSDADVAVASDKDVDALFNEIPQDTRAALCDLSPKVVVDEHGAGRICLEPSSSDFVRDVQASNGDPGERFGQVTSCCSDTTTTDTNQIDRFFNAMLRLGQEALSTLLGESSRTSGSSNATSIKESGGADIAQSPYGNNVEQRNNPQPPSVMDEPKIISSQRWGQKSRSDSLTTAHEAASASSPSVLSAEVPTPSFETQKSMYQHNPQLPPDFDVQSRQHPPSIHTDNFPYPDPGDFMPSPVSSPADDPIAPQSHYARQLSSSSLSPRHDESEASGSDVSATELPSPTHQAYPSPTTQRGTIPGSRPLQSPQGSASASSLPGSDNSKTYSFASLPGIAMKKSPRRRYDEIERLYQCSWPNCTKAYGTLNHLNAHITTQRHGPKRTPNEFKELRKEWRQENKKAEEAERERERAEQAQLIAGRDMTMQDVGPSWTDSPTQRPAPTCEPAQVYDGSLTLPSPQ